MHDRRDERDRSRYGNRLGSTLEDGSGCLTIGVHLTFKTAAKTYTIGVYLTFARQSPRPFTMQVSIR
jgi:hypothetical protein